MNIRSVACNWFNGKYGKSKAKVYTSRFYSPDISYPKKAVWFLQIPLNAIDLNTYDHVNLICQKKINGKDFHYLKVPAKYFHKHINTFDRIKSNIAIYLSANPDTLFVEERGTGRLDFSEFVVNK